jgi:molecular chaperone GrpE
MNETDELIDEILGDEEVKIPVNDKRRFSPEGERMGGSPETESKEPQVSPRELELEARLKEETTRREAAESKLVGVQAKFEEAKANLEKETSDMRARLKKTLEDRAKQSQLDFLKTLLPVLDNLNLAISASETDPSVEHLRDGVVGTARSFEQALLSVGVEPVPGVGADFNPEVHEAIDMAEVEAEQDGKVTSEYQRGYRFGDQLLRPARVQVGRGRAQSAS